MRDSYNNESAAIAITPGVFTASPTPVTVDLLGFGGALLVVQAGIGGITFTGTNRVDYTLQHSDDNSTYTNVADSDLIGVSGTSNGILRSLIALKAAADVVRYGYRGTKRYLQFTPVFGGTHGSGTAFSAVVIRSAPQVQPTP